MIAEPQPGIADGGQPNRWVAAHVTRALRLRSEQFRRSFQGALTYPDCLSTGKTRARKLRAHAEAAVFGAAEAVKRNRATERVR